MQSTCQAAIPKEKTKRGIADVGTPCHQSSGWARTWAALEFPDHLFRSQFGFRLGPKIIRGHEARCRPAQDESAGLSIRGDGRAPLSRPALIGHNRKLR